jgi:UDP-glucose 4-epimerase
MNWKNKKALVIGGAGFIGATLVRKLVAQNAEVVIIDNFSFGQAKKIPQECRLIGGNVVNSETFSQVGEIDYIFHFGAGSSVILFNKNAQKYIYETLSGFINVMDFAGRIGVKKVIYPSSGSVYGKAPTPHGEKASTPLPTNLYGKCKLICENIASLYSIPTVGLRIFAGYGPGEDHKGEISSVVTLFLNSILRKERPIIYGNGSQSRDFVYIDDVADAVLNSAEESVQGIINVGSGKSYSFNEVLEILNTTLGTSIHASYVNKPVDYLEKTLADTTMMKKLLKIKPTSLRNGITRYLKAEGLVD